MKAHLQGSAATRKGKKQPTYNEKKKKEVNCARHRVACKRVAKNNNNNDKKKTSYKYSSETLEIKQEKRRKEKDAELPTP